MDVNLFVQDKIGNMQIRGMLTFNSLKEFEQRISSFDYSGVATVILDLAELEHTDSSGVSGIIQLQKILSNLKITLKIGKISSRVERLFEQMHLFEIIPRCEN